MTDEKGVRPMNEIHFYIEWMKFARDIKPLCYDRHSLLRCLLDEDVYLRQVKLGMDFRQGVRDVMAHYLPYRFAVTENDGSVRRAYRERVQRNPIDIDTGVSYRLFGELVDDIAAHHKAGKQFHFDSHAPIPPKAQEWVGDMCRLLAMLNHGCTDLIRAEQKYHIRELRNAKR